ncbi:MAG: YceI family protein [Ferruginibacter sp.]
MKKIYVAFFLLFIQSTTHAQTRLYSKEARISFFSKTAMENIVAQNNKALCVWDIASSRIEFSVLIKGFEFDRALMQEHFNENYMESDKYPKAYFKGTIKSETALVLQGDKSYSVKAVGVLTIHGVSKEMIIPATITCKDGVISSRADFTVQPSDFKISIPSIVADKINKQISISVLVPAYKNL